MDEMDRKIAAGLQLNGRAAWRDIAAVVGTTESTVARRAQRLIDAGLVQIAVSQAPSCLGKDQVVTGFFRCSPGQQLQVAETLADFPEAWYVGVVAGDADVMCQITVAGVESLLEVLLRSQQVPGVVSSEVEPITRIFKVTYGWARDLLPDDGAMLDARPRPHALGPHDLTDVDHAIIALLQEDARMAFTTVATRLQLHQSTVSRHFEALREQGCINIATFVDHSAMGYQPPMMLKIDVAPGRLQAVAEELAGYASVRYMAASSGRVGLLVESTVAASADIYDFMTRVVGSLDGVRGIQVWTELRALKRGYVRLRLAENGQTVSA
jgi:DNA-binding Lrp family transcriptional regulator